MEHAQLFFILACALSFFAAYGIGANDVANAMGTSVGSRALSLKQAIIAAAIFEALGAIMAGGEVTQTIGKGIIDFNDVALPADIIVKGMLASLAAAGTWLLLASRLGWPVSTTHCIIGAVMGFGCVVAGVDAVYWGKITSIAASWVITPVIAGAIAYGIFMSLQKRILDTANPLANATRFGPYYLFALTFILTLVTFTKGLKHTAFYLPLPLGIALSLLLACVLTLIGRWRIQRFTSSIMQAASLNPRQHGYVEVEKIFAVMMIFTACAMAFAHGSNDVANAIGPLATVLQLTQTSAQQLTEDAIIPLWILCLGGLGITLGLATLGYRVIATVGEGITSLTPSRGFAAELATATTVIIASGTGLPISTTQTLVGAILGVGFARGIAALNLRVIRNIFMSWLITLPAGAVLSLLYFYCFQWIFNP